MDTVVDALHSADTLTCVLDKYRPADLAPARRTDTHNDETIAQLLARAQRPTFSVEFFPPKTDDGATILHEAIEKLEPWNPDFVSVTYGANGSLRDRTLDAVRDIVSSTSLRVVGHLTCTGQSVDEIKSVIDAYGDLGVHHILAIRGDMPGGPSQPWEAHPAGLRNATELVELVKSRGDY